MLLVTLRQLLLMLKKICISISKNTQWIIAKYLSQVSIFSKMWVNTDCLKFWMKLNYFSKVCWKKLLFIGRTDVEAEAPWLWPLDAKNQLIGEDPDAGKDWGQEQKGVTEDEMVGWHHLLSGHEFEDPVDTEIHGCNSLI